MKDAKTQSCSGEIGFAARLREQQIEASMASRGAAVRVMIKLRRLSSREAAEALQDGPIATGL